VLQETTILNWRRFYERDFVIIPVYLPPIQPSDLNAGLFAALDLAKLHGLKGSREDGVSGIVTKVVDSFEAHHAMIQETQNQLESRLSTMEAVKPVNQSGESVDQAAAICYKQEGDQTKFLLIHTSNGKRWIFPKGWAHKEEPLWLTAQLDARKEAGVAGDVRREDPIPFQFKDEQTFREKKSLNVVAFPLKVVSEFEPDQEWRDPGWCTLEEAKHQLSIKRVKGRHLHNRKELHRVIDEAHKRLSSRQV